MTGVKIITDTVLKSQGWLLLKQQAKDEEIGCAQNLCDPSKVKEIRHYSEDFRKNPSVSPE